MIAFINGQLADVTEQTVVVDCNGIGYEVFVPASVNKILPRIGAKFLLHTYLQVKEDGMALFGFANKDDLNIFKMLLTVNGIGPKGALGILSALTADELRFAVLAEDAKAIARAPGIGNKTAGKLILELKDKFKLEDAFEHKLVNQAALTASDASVQDGTIRKEAIEALTALGYSPSDAMRAVKKVALTEDMTVNMLLKQSLKNI